MVRESDSSVRQHFEVKDKVFQCKHCGDEFKGKPSVTRLRYHLLGERNKGISPCEKVPEHLKVDIQIAHSNKSRLRYHLLGERNKGISTCERVPLEVDTPIALSNKSKLRYHLLGKRNKGISTCERVPEHLEVDPQIAHFNKRRRMLESSPVNNEMPNPTSMPKQPRTRQDGSIALLTSELVGESYKNKLDEIWSSLNKEDVFKIGIYGMGGAGKTELARHIHNSLLEHADYDFVCWITMSPRFSIRKLQNKIANAINFKLPNKDVEIIRAELSRRLFDKKFVIILDDIWSYISLHHLGMTDDGLIGCKLIMTTRSLHICRTMNCQINVFVPSLSNRSFQDQSESWRMFVKELGKEESLSGEIVTAAKDIVRECGGLPMMIKSMARNMRGVRDIEEWRYALEEMKSCKMNEPYVEVFHQLKRSYDHLKDQSLRHCFHYCALFNCAIERGELIEHLIMEGIIEGRGNRRAKRDCAHTLLNKLHNVCLLICNGFLLEMHESIRKMAFLKMKEEFPCKVEFSEEIKYLLMEDKMRISLNLSNEAMNPSDYVATCPNVSTLLIRYHKWSTLIEDSFFSRFQNLKVLNFSFSTIVEFPKSVGDLKNLKALFLRCCYKLKHIPSLAKLELLEVLDLSYCAVEEVPEGVQCLSNLRVFNLIGSDIEELEAGILKRLSRLEFLAFDKPSKLGEEIAGLSKLESLIWCFSDFHEFDYFLSNASCSNLDAYLINVTECDLGVLQSEEPGDRKIRFYGYSIERQYLFCLSSCLTLLERVEELRLSVLSNLSRIFGRETEYGVSPNTTPPQTSLFSNLKIFVISDCNSIQNLFPLYLLSNLQNLQVLFVRRCSAMEEIIAAPEQDLTHANSHPNSIHQTLQLSLPKLKNLYLENLPELTRICPAQINCKSLDSIKIIYCENLKKIPISLPLQSLNTLEVFPETWWGSVIWGSSEQKDILQSRFVK